MSQVYNPESEAMAEIERLELEARQIRRSIEHDVTNLLPVGSRVVPSHD